MGEVKPGSGGGCRAIFSSRHFATSRFSVRDLPERRDDRRHAKALSRGEMHVFIAKKKPGKLKIIGISTHLILRLSFLL
jgi:hypothetical protein